MTEWKIWVPKRWSLILWGAGRKRSMRRSSDMGLSPFNSYYRYREEGLSSLLGLLGVGRCYERACYGRCYEDFFRLYSTWCQLAPFWQWLGDQGPTVTIEIITKISWKIWVRHRVELGYMGLSLPLQDREEAASYFVTCCLDSCGAHQGSWA